MFLTNPAIKRITRVLSAAALIMGLTVSAHAQAINTAPLSGVVQSEEGRAISGAKVKITHEPTATVTMAVTDARGVFSRPDLRPGGPYTIEVDATGMAPAKIEAIYLNAETGAFVPVNLSQPDIVQMERYTVTANPTSALFDPNATDKVSFISNQEIQDMVKGERTLGSLLANDPRIIYNRNPEQQYISVGGINNRYNQIMVDGVSVSDPFGLNSNNLAAQGNVIPIEVIESIAVSTTPYNARKAGFTGAYINAVTKTGGNEFHGSVYYTFRNQDFVSDKLDGVSMPIEDFKEQTYGLSLNGPIIKNKLFFSGAIEQKNYNKPAPAPGYPLAPETMQQLLDAIATLNTGTAANGKVINTGTVPFDVGGHGAPGSNDIKDTVATLKLDWQINNDHRLTLGYQYSKGNRPTFPGFGTSGQVSMNNFSFDNSWYTLTKESSAITAAWTAHWSDKLYTEVNVGRKKYEVSNDYQKIQPSVIIHGVPVITGTSALTPSGSSNSAYVTWGSDRSYHMNSLEVTTDTVEIFASYKPIEGHTFEAGIQYESNDAYNVYVQNTAGYYVFSDRTVGGVTTSGWTCFLNYVDGLASSIGTYNYNQIVPGVDPAASFTEANIGLFIRDLWRVTRSFTLDLNLRVDLPIIDKAPAFNQGFYDAFNVRNDNTYDGEVVLQPRIGFNWQPKINDSKLKTIVRGGLGLFYGKMPRVWLGNSYSNTGFNYLTYNASNISTLTMSSDPDNQPTGGINLPATQTVNYVSPNFKLPTRWKGNLAFEQELPWWGMRFTAEVEHTIVEHDIFYKAMNLKAGSHDADAPDGRPMYWNSYNASTGAGSGVAVINSKFSTACMELANTSEGQNTMVTFAVERPMRADGWRWLAAYTYTQAIEATYGNSSVASSNWNSRTVFDPNAVEPHRGDGEIRHRFLVNITKRLNLLPVGPTTITLTYNGRSGLPYSLRAGNDVNGDGRSNNDIMYIPAFAETSIANDGNTASRHIFPSAEVRDDFYRIVKHYGLAEGKLTKVNGQRYPWVNHFDLHIAQEVKLPGWRHKLEFAVDVLNVGNLLNDKWGLVYGSDQAYVKGETMANVAYDNNTKAYTYSQPRTALLSGNYFRPWIDSYAGEPASSRWSILFSVRYKF